MIALIASTLIGAFIGFITGVVYAVVSDDGIWLDVWAILIIVGALCGAAIGGLI